MSKSKYLHYLSKDELYKMDGSRVLDTISQRYGRVNAYRGYVWFEFDGRERFSEPVDLCDNRFGILIQVKE